MLDKSKISIKIKPDGINCQVYFLVERKAFETLLLCLFEPKRKQLFYYYKP
jgi:hypothetical protein